MAHYFLSFRLLKVMQTFGELQENVSQGLQNFLNTPSPGVKNV